MGLGMSTSTYQLQLSKNSAAKPTANTWTTDSDERLKKNIVTIDGALDKIMRLRGVTYEWKDPSTQGEMKGRYMGLIAQETEKVFPEWVGTGPGGYKDMTISGFQGLVAEAMRALNRKKNLLKARLEDQRARIDSLKEKLAGKKK